MSNYYDNYIENGSGTSLLSFTDPSASLLTEFTSNDLYCNGTSANNAHGGTNPRIYAPGTWQAGSSYSHWNEGSYPPGNVNSLMTPGIAPGEANHDPGPITAGFFEDMLWTICDAYLSTSDLSAAKPLEYYPNPVNSELNINALSLMERIEVYNMLGQKILETRPNATQYKLDLSPLVSGAYFVKAQIDNKIETFRVIKQ